MDLTDRRVLEILDGAMVARIATVSRTGRPHVNPLYFVVEDGHILLGTSDPTLAVHNVRANPNVQVLFEVERDPGDRRLLRMDGTAVVRADDAVQSRYRRRVARKYMVNPAGLWNFLTHPRQWGPMRRHVGRADGCVLDVDPTAVTIL